MNVAEATEGTMNDELLALHSPVNAGRVLQHLFERSSAPCGISRVDRLATKVLIRPSRQPAASRAPRDGRVSCGFRPKHASLRCVFHQLQRASSKFTASSVCQCARMTQFRFDVRSEFASTPCPTKPATFRDELSPRRLADLYEASSAIDLAFGSVPGAERNVHNESP